MGKNKLHSPRLCGERGRGEGRSASGFVASRLGESSYVARLSESSSSAGSLPPELVLCPGPFINRRGLVEGLVLRVLANERELHIGREQPERLGNVEHTQDVQEM